ncbi:MAG: MliC family protein [Patescibacteria group bacterium]
MIKNLIIAVVGLLILGGVFVYIVPMLDDESAQVACTQEAMLCLDGSYVGRTGPSCEFAACPALPPAVYSCDNDKSVTVTFASETAMVELSDGRTMLLTLKEAASGAKYTNSDESFVFWTQDYGAFIEENGVTTFAACHIDDLTFPEVN